MKMNICVLVVATIVGFSAQARDSRAMYNYQDALSTADAKAKLTDDVKFYFGKQTAPPAAQEFGEFTANRKTNAFNKSDYAACQWAFLSAMISLRDRARQLGGNAVVNIKSNYKGVLKDSDTQFECGAGGVVAGVTLMGKVIKTK